MQDTALELLAERRGSTPLDLALDTFSMWYDASQALALNKEYTISNGQNSQRKLTRADADEVKKMYDFWENEVARLQGKSINAPKLNTLWTVP